MNESTDPDLRLPAVLVEYASAHPGSRIVGYNATISIELVEPVGVR